MGVECGKRLVEEQEVCSAREDARKGSTLLLAAREAGRIGIFDSFQREARDVLGEDALLFLPRSVQREDDILAYGHVREEGIVLEEIADPARLRREVDAPLAVVERAPVQQDLPAVRTFEACDALERHALAAARGAEEGEGCIGQCEIRRERKAAQTLFDVDDKLHSRTSRFR